MKKLYTLGFAALIAAAGVGTAVAQQTGTLSAAPANFPGDFSGDTAEIGTTGNDDSQTYLNIEGAGNGASYETFGVIDFTGVPGLPTVTDADYNSEIVNYIDPNLTLDLTDSPYYAAPGTLDFYLSEDNAAPLSSLTYQAGTADGVGSQLGPLTLLGTGAYTSMSVGNVPDSMVYQYGLTLPDTASQDYILNQLNTGGNIRLVVTADPTTPNVAGTFFGATGTAPTLTLTVAVPEANTPALVALGLLGVVGLGVARRRVA